MVSLDFLDGAPRRLLTFLTAALVAAAASAWLAGPVMRVIAHQTAETHMRAYIQVRGEQQAELFQAARAANLAALEAYELHRAALSAVPETQILAQFDRYFPEFGDGTRRSRAKLFDGGLFADGEFLYGIGAYLGDAGQLTADEVRTFLAAFRTVRALGEAHRRTFGNFYFFDGRRRVVMFAPDRPDRLEFYRLTAPADFDMRGDEDAALLDPATNPDAAMQCTPLSRYLYEDEGERFGSACRIPLLDADGRRIGGFGMSIDMTDYLARAVGDPPPGAVSILLDRDGVVMSRSDVQDGYLRMQEDPLDLAASFAELRLQDAAAGVLPMIEDRYLVGYARIDGPGWSYLSLVDLDALHAPIEAFAWRLFVLVFAVAAVAGVLFEAARFAIRRLAVRLEQPPVRVLDETGKDSPLAIYRSRS